VVLLRALQERRPLETEQGRVAVGWLIVEDLAMVQTLVLLSPVAGLLGGCGQAVGAADNGEIARALAITFTKVAAFVRLCWSSGGRLSPGSCITSRRPVLGSCSAWRFSRWRWASPMGRSSCSAPPLPWLERRRAVSAQETPAHEGAGTNLPTTTLEDHMVLVGFGRVGSRVGQELGSEKMAFLVIEDRNELVEQLRASGIEAIPESEREPTRS
jgi:hypothetical protein